MLGYRLAAVWLWGMVLTVCADLPVIFDFETGDLQGWRIVEGAFGKVISDRAYEHNHSKAAYTKQGRYFMTTLEMPNDAPSDQYVGILESPVVVFAKPELSLRVGGGKGDGVGVSVHTLDGRQVARFAGEGNETMYIRQAVLPQIVGKPVFFRVSDTVTGSWCHITVDDIRGHATLDKVSTEKRFNARKVQLLESLRNTLTAESLRLAIAENQRDYPQEYPAEVLLTELDGLEKENAPLASFGYRALVALNPRVNRVPILFVTRMQYRRDHHNTATMFQKGEINQGSYVTNGCLKLHYPATGGTVTLLEPGVTGTVRDPEVSWDGCTVVFSMRRNRDDDYHIYTLELSAGKLTQLTTASGVSDIDPAWLPSGQIVFTSTREPKYCMCNRHIMGNLFRMNGDGTNIIQIGKSTLHEGHSSILPDGRVLYDRWEYVDRNFGDAQGLWTCNPDGTRHAIFWGNNTTSPGGVIDARPLSVPNRVIAVLASCHDRPWGALGILDRGKGVDGKEPVVRTWPLSYVKSIKQEGQNFDSTVSLRIKYEDPYPLDDEHFLCSRMIGVGEQMGVYYLDLFGNEILIHTEEPGCFDPVPLRVRPRPPVLTDQRHFDSPKATGVFYVQNVYDGTHMQGVKPGSIRSLRIVESPEKRSWSARGWQGQGEQAPAMNWHNFENKRILGTVPVEADGSAAFEVPANTFVFFQALDENGMMVQSMRSGAYLQPGETTGCAGCHENRLAGTPATAMPAAMKRQPSRLNGWYGTPRLFSFQVEVQPVFDRYCLDCHDYGKPAADKLTLAGDHDFIFATSYTDLWATGAIHCIGGGPATIQTPYSWGSHASKLTKKLLDHHHGKQLAPEDIDRVITWLDLNAPYYPRYECAFPANPTGRSPLTINEIKRIEQLAKAPLHTAFYKRQRSQLSFDRPEKSRVLQTPELQKNNEARDAVLALIRQGAARLREQPRADMEGFQLIPADVCRQTNYEERQAQELRTYQAIKEGLRLNDTAKK